MSMIEREKKTENLTNPDRPRNQLIANGMLFVPSLLKYTVHVRFDAKTNLQSIKYPKSCGAQMIVVHE